MPGLVALVLVGAGYDVWAVKRRHQTISAAIWQLRCNRWGNAAWLAVVALGLAHFERRA